MTDEMVYEVRVDGKIVGQFTSKSKALAEKRKYIRASVVTTWVTVPDQPKTKKKAVPKKEEPKKAAEPKPKKRSIFKREPKKETKKKPAVKKKPVQMELKPTEDMPVNTWLQYKRMEPVPNNLTLHQIYSAIYIDTFMLEDVLGDCHGRKAEILRAVSEAMGVVTVRMLEERLQDNARNRVKELWMSPAGWWTVTSDVASDFKQNYASITGPYFLAAYSNRAQCDPNIRDSDLSVQPFEDGLAVCYRDLRAEKVYLVMKKVEWVDHLAVNCLELHGKDKNGRPMKMTLNYSDIPGASKRRKKLIEAGWYKVDDEYYVHLRQMKKVAPPGFVCIETVAAYPSFGKTEYQNKIAYFDLTWNIMDFMQDKFNASNLEFIECPDSISDDIWALPEALERYPRRRIY